MAKWIFVLCLLLQEALSSMTQIAQRIANLSFERSMFCVKYFGGWHGKEHCPYIGYG